MIKDTKIQKLSTHMRLMDKSSTSWNDWVEKVSKMKLSINFNIADSFHDVELISISLICVDDVCILVSFTVAY